MQNAIRSACREGKKINTRGKKSYLARGRRWLAAFLAVLWRRMTGRVVGLSSFLLCCFPLQLCSPLFPLLLLSTMFFLLCSGFAEVLVVVERKPTMPLGGYEGGSGWEVQ
jgi:hypothetical protein